MKQAAMDQDAHGVSAKQRDELLLMHEIVIFSAFVDRSAREGHSEALVNHDQRHFPTNHISGSHDNSRRNGSSMIC